MRMPRTSNPLPVFEFFQARPAEKTVGTFILFFQIPRHVSAPDAATMALLPGHEANWKAPKRRQRIRRRVPDFNPAS